MTSKKEEKKKKRTALVSCRDRKEFWITQTHLWQWVREGVIAQTGNQSLTGRFAREHEELMVVFSHPTNGVRPDGKGRASTAPAGKNPNPKPTDDRRFVFST